MQKAFNVFARVFGFMVTVFWLIASVSTASAQSILPTMTANYSPSSVNVGTDTSLIYEITNSDTVTTTNLAFTHTLPASLTVGSGVLTTTCGPGTATAPSGGNTITLANGFVERGSPCTIVVPIATATVASFQNGTGDLTSSLGNSGPTTTNLLTVNSGPVTPLQLVQSIAPSSITVGAKSTLTFTFDNTASAIAIGSFSFNDTLPTGMTIDPDVAPTNTCVNANASFPPTFTVDAGNGTISLFASGFTFAGFEVLAAGASCQIDVPLIGASAASFVNASAGATYNRSGESNVPTNGSTATLTVTGSPPGAPLMVKAFTDDPVDPGAEVSVRYTITNQDRDFAATNVAFTDDLDAALLGLTFSSLTSNTCGGTVSGAGTGLLSFAGGSLAGPGASCVIVASATAPSAAAGSYPSPTGTVTADINGASVTGNAASDSLVLRGAAAPTGTASFTDSTQGGTTTMTVVLTNQSTTQTATDLTYATSFSGGFPITSANSTPFGGACGASSTFTFITSSNPPAPSDATPASLSMSSGELAPGASCTLTWTMNLRPDAPGGTFTNVSDAIAATVGSEPVTGGRTTGSMTVGGGLNMNFVKAFSSTVVPGGTVNVIFAISNAAESTATATDINFTDDVGAMLAGTTADIGAATNTCGGTLSGTSVIGFTSGSLAPGAECEISVPLNISAAAANGTYTNTTTSMLATPTGGTAQDYGTASADLSVFSVTGTGAFTPSDVIAGETTNVAFTLTNNGADDATGVTYTFNAADMASGTTVGPSAVTNTCGGTYTAIGSGFAIYSGGTVSAGSSCVLEVPIITSASTPAGSKVLPTSDVNATVNGSAVTFDSMSAVLNISDAALNFSKAFGPTTVQAGSVTTLTFNIENTSTSAAVSSLTFSDNLDSNFLLGATVLGQSSNTCGGSISGISSGLFSYSGGTLPASASCSVAITVQLPSGISGAYENTSSQATGMISGLAVTGSPAKATLNVTSAAQPTFVKSFTPDNIAPNSTTTVSYTITNPAGGTGLTSLQFSDAIGTAISGATLTYPVSSGVCGAGSTVSGGSTLLLSGGNLAAGESCTFTATLNVPLISAATFTSTTGDLRDNGLLAAGPASDDLIVTQPAPTFAQAFAPTSIAQGGTSTVTFSVNNSNSADTASSLSFNANLPTGLSIAATPNASTTCGGMGNATAGATSFTYSGGTVTAGATCTVQFDVTSQTAGDAELAFINLSSNAGIATAVRATLSVTAAPSPGFAAIFSPTTVNQGNTSTLTYTIDNGSALISAGTVDFTTALPAGMIVADVPNASTTCTGGTLTSVAGSGIAAYTGGSIPAGTSCTVQVDVHAIGSGSLIATSGDLTSSLGNSGTAAATLAVTAAPAPSFSKAFTPASIEQGAQSSLVLTINNSGSAIEATALDFTDTFPAGMIAALAPGASTTCTGGTVTAAPGGSSLSYTGGTIAAGATCTVSLTVTSATAGGAINTTGDLTSSLGNSGTASSTLTVNAAAAPAFSAVFAPDSIAQGATSSLTFTINSSSALIDVTTLDFTNALPAGVTIASTPNASTTCTSGTLTAAAGAGSIGYTGGTVLAGGTCTVQVDVTSGTAGAAVNTSGDLTSSQGNSGTASDTLTVTAAAAPAFSAVFTPDSIAQGGTSTLTFTIDSSTALIDVTALDFTNSLPGGLTIAATPNASTTCTSGTLSAAAGAGSLSYTGGTVLAGATCTVQLDVTSATSGAVTNTSGDLTSSQGNSGTASDVLTVNAATTPAFSAVFTPDSIAQGGTSTLTFTIDSSTALIDVTALDFTNSLPGGLTIAATPNASTTCTSGTLSAAAGAGSLSYTGGTVLAGATCTVQLDVTSATAGAATNTSGDLTSSQGNSGTAADTLTVTASPAPTFNMSVAPSTINQGAVTTVTFNVDNAGSLVSADTLGFDFALPAGVDFAPTLNFSSDCVGGVATPNASGARLTSTTLAAGASCSAQFDVTASNAGSTVFTTGDLTSSLGNSGTASATLSVSAAGVPTFSASFAPASIVQGSVTTLTFAIDNSANLVAAQTGAFSNTFPANMTVAATPNFVASCTGTSTAGTGSFTGGGNSLALTGIEVGASASCSYAIDVTTGAGGSFVNTSGDLITSLGNSGPAAAVLSVSNAPIPDFDGTYLPDTIVQGAGTVLAYTIDNSTSLVEASGLGFSSRLPTGVTVASPLMVDTTCTGGAVNTSSGSTGFVFSGGAVAAGDSCSVSIGVTATTAGVGSETSSVLTTSLGDTAAGVTATLTVTGAPLPTFTAAYNPATIIQGDTTTLAYNIANTTALVGAANLAFSETLPVGLTVSATPNITNDCGGTLNATAGSGTISYTVGTVAAGAQCVVQFDVTSVTVGDVTGTAGPLTSSLGDSGTATSALSVTGAQTPVFAKTFAPATIAQGDVSTLTFSIDNSAALVDATTLAFTDPMPGGMVVAATPNITNGCTGGTLTAVSGSSSIVLADAIVAASSSCVISVDITRADAGTVTNVTGDLTSSLGNSGTATDALTTTAATAPSFVKAFAPATIVQGGVSTLTFTIDNAAALVDGTALAFSDNMPSGMIVAPTPNITNTCTGGTLTAAVGSSSITLAGSTVPASASCAISVDVTRADAGTVTNVTGDLTSSLGNSGTATDALTTTAAAAPSFVKAFAPATIVQGEVSTLTFTIDNASALVDATALSFSDNMPSGMSVAPTPNVTNTCTGGAVTATAGSSSINLAGATVAAAANCTVSVDVTLSTAGASTNVTGDLTSSLGNSGTAAAILTATGAAAPNFSKAFSPSSIAQGEVSTLTFTINNAAAAVDATGLTFSDTFPAGMTVASTPNASSTCSSGSLTAAAGAGVVSYAGGAVASGASCVVSVNVTATTVQAYANTSGDLTSSLGNSGAASASLTVTASTAPGFSGSYSPPSIPQGGTSRLSLTINNMANSVPAGSLGFSVSLPSGVTIDDAPRSFTSLPDASSTCGGSVTAVGGATSVSLSGGSVAAGSTCTVSVNVTSQNVGTVGPISGSLSSSLGGTSVVPSAPLVVVTNPQGRVTFVQNTSEDGTFTFSSTESLLNFSITTAGGSGSRGPIDLTQGTYVITQSRPAGIGNTAFSCSDNDSIGDLLSGTLTLTLGPNESVTCTYSSINTAQKTSEVINSFLQRRNNLILSNGPTKGRRMARLSQGIGGSETLSFQRGNLKSFAPVNFNLLSSGSGTYDISTSLYQVERSALMFGLAHDGVDGSTAVFQPRRFDIWFEAHYSEFKASQGSSGHFGIAYLGADYLITPDFLAGVMLQFDSFTDESTTNNSRVSGTGWMVGPYVTARVAPNLIFDGRVSYGQSTNEVSPNNTYTDEFDTDRFLIDASLSGSFDWDKWVVSPALSISYIEERQDSYISSNGNLIGKQKVSLGQIKFGPTFSTTIQGNNHSVIEPSFTLNGIYNFANRSGPSITNNTADETDGLRARVEAAVRVTNRSGTRFEFGANYDGIGQDDFESWGANLKLTIPLQ